MPKLRIPFLSLAPRIALALSLLQAGLAGAMGFGPSSPSVALGQPLDFYVGLRLEPNEVIEPACVRAEVSIGDNTVSPAGVGAMLVPDGQGGQRVRVQTLVRVDEPVVAVQVTVGCTDRMTRRFVVFADPPVMVVAPAPIDPPVVAAPAPNTTTAASARASGTGGIASAAPSGAPASSGPPVAAPAPAPVSRPVLAPSAVSAPRDTRPARGSVDPSSAAPAPADTVRTEAADKPARPSRPAARAADRAASAAPDPALKAAAPAPKGGRLKLDAAPPPATPPAPPMLPPDVQAVVAQANEAVLAAIAAASASQGRIAALEASVQQLGSQSILQREEVERLRARAAEADRPSPWIWPLAAIVVALLVLAGWLWMRLRELERDRQQSWLAAARGPQPTPAARPPVPPSPSQVPVLVERSVRTTGVASLGAGLAPVHVPEPSDSDFIDAPTTTPQEWKPLPPEMAMARTQPLMPADVPAVENRAVTAEELIDLEQQAEFFVVLGQDDAAIDLLVSHLRDSGGASPLPYLKLLDIYRRLGDSAAYERTRDRFNHRFNAHVPGWDAPQGEGQALEEYPRVMGWIQHVWPRPLDAMAELEALMFRKDGGELFDLPAYREVLLLYALARDLLDGDAGGAAAQSVDVLLPLNDTPGFAHTSPRPYFGDEMGLPLDAQPTAPLDLDLGLPTEEAPFPSGSYGGRGGPGSRYR